MRSKRSVFALALACAGFASAAMAQTTPCPDFYRFVDFGLTDANGHLNRGGTLLRVESLAGVGLLKPTGSLCRFVQHLGSDGHGNPIPVVHRVEFDPARLSLPLATLAVTGAQDTAAVAEENATVHADTLGKPGTQSVAGDRFLCARPAGTESTSCQVVSPYRGNRPVVIYCDDGVCELPVLAMDDQIYISASWPQPDDTLEGLGKATLDMLARIATAFEPLR